MESTRSSTVAVIDAMSDKPFYLSKAKISGILLFVGGALTLAGKFVATGELDVSGLTMLLTGTGIFGIRDAL